MTILGQILRRSERRETAIYLRDGVLWVADFVDGDGQLVDAAGGVPDYNARVQLEKAV